MTDNPWRILVTDLLRRVGAQRAVRIDAPVGKLGEGMATVTDETPVHFDGLVERVPEGVVVRGSIRTEWSAACSRCLAPITATTAVHADELYERDPVPGETYQLETEYLDLAPLVCDAIVLELPQAPLCRDDCAGLCPGCGIDRNSATCDCTFDVPDPRWAALRSLEL